MMSDLEVGTTLDGAQLRRHGSVTMLQHQGAGWLPDRWTST